MKKIDDIFKNGINETGLPYSDQEWQATEKMIAAQSSKAGLWLVKNIAILVILAAAIGSLLRFNLDKVETVETQKHPVNTSNQVLDVPVAATPQTDDATVKTLEQSGSEESITQQASSNSHLNPDHSNSDQLTIAHTAGDGRDNLENSDLSAAQEKKSFVDMELRDEQPDQQQEDPREEDSHNPAEIVEAEQALIRRDFDQSFVKSLMDPAFSFSLTDASLLDAQEAEHRPASNKVQLFLSPYFANYSSSRKIDTDAPTELKGEESIQNAKEIGVDLSIQRKNWAFSTGLSKLTFEETTNYSRQEAIYGYDTSLVLVKRDFETNPRGGSVALITKQIDSTQIGQRELVDCPDCQVRMEYLKIPLQLQFEKSKGRSGLYVRLGTSIHLPYKVSGVYALKPNIEISNDWTIRDIQTSDLGRYFGFNYALGTRYSLSHKLAIWIEVAGENGRNSMLQDYGQRYNLLGLKGGVRYQFAALPWF
jgi:hypothetical protein